MIEKNKRKMFIIIGGVYAFLLGAVFYPFLFGGKIFLDSDITTYYYGAFSFYHQAILAGQSFFWNPMLFSGFPIYLSQVGGFFDPVNFVLFHWLDGFGGLHARLFFDYFLVLIASYVAGRAWGMSHLASFSVGLGYMMAFNQTYISNPLFANSAFIMPFLVWVFGKLKSQNGFNFLLAIFTGVAVGFSFLGGYAQVIIMSLTLFGLLGILYVFTALPTVERKQFFTFFIYFCGITGVVGFLVGLPQIFPALDFTPLTRRGDGVSYALASLKSINLGDFSLFLFPDYVYFPYLSAGRKALYVGAIWFLLAFGVIAVVIRSFFSRFPDSTREFRIFTILFIFTLLIAVKYSPIFYLLQHLPIFSLFRFPDRWMYPGIFFLSMLGGYGFDMLTRGVVFSYLKHFYFAICGFVSVFLAGILFFSFANEGVIKSLGSALFLIFSKFFFGEWGFIKDLEHYSESIASGLNAWKDFVSISDISFGIPVLMIILAIALILALMVGVLPKRRFGFLVTALMVVTFISSVSFQFSDTLSRSEIANIQSNTYGNFFPIDERKLYRIYPVMVDVAFQKVVAPTYRLSSEQNKAINELAFSTGWPNTNFHSGISSVDGYDVFIPRVYIDTLAMSGSTFGAQDSTRSLSLQDKLGRLTSHLDVIGMMGGKYIISGVPLNSSDLAYKGFYNATRLSIPIYVYENLLALPRVYFANSVEESGSISLVELVEKGKRDFSATTYLDCARCVAETFGQGRIEESVFKNGEAHLKITARGDSWIIFSESYLPGWVAKIDGQVVDIVRANGLYISVLVPEGSHSVDFMYHGVVNL